MNEAEPERHRLRGGAIPVFGALDENGEVFESKTLAGKTVLISKGKQ